MICLFVCLFINLLIYLDQTLSKACQEGDLLKVRSIISSQHEHGTISFLIIALDNGHDDTISLLFDMIEQQNVKREILDCAARSGNVNIFEETKKRGWNIKDEEGLIHAAAISGKTEVVSFLIENRVNVNERDESKNIPLHYACSNGHVQVVELLVRHGADVNAINGLHYSPLWLSIKISNLETTKLLLNTGAEIFSSDFLFYKCCGKNLEVC